MRFFPPALIRCLTAGLCGFVLTAVLPAADLRTWTDSTGKFTVKARFGGLADGKVTLDVEGGQPVEIPLDKLSAADQTYIKSLPADNPFQPKTVNPFAPRSTTPAPAPGGAAPPASASGMVDDSGAFESRIVRPPLASARSIELFNSGDGWQVDPAALASAEARSFAGKPFRLPPKTNFHEKTSAIVFNPAGTHALVGFHQNFPRDTTHTRLVLVDLASGKVTANRTTGGQLAPLALADDARTVVMKRDEFGFGNSDRLEVWQLSESAITKGPAWRPFDDDKGSDRDVLLAEFTAQGELLTASAGGKVIAWSVEPLQPLWTCLSAKGCRPALSPNRRFLLTADKNQLSLLDLERQQVVAAMPMPSRAFPKLSFNQSGSRFAAMTQSVGYVWDTATGQQVREIESSLLPAMGSPAPILFANDDQILCGGKYLVDLPSLIPLWQYDGADKSVEVGDAVWFVVTDGERNPAVLFGARLPQPGVKEALDKAMADPNFFIVKPGARLKLNLDRLPDPAERDKLRETLTRKLQEKELQVDPAAEVELTAYFDPPQQKDVAYHGFGGLQTVSFNETIARLELTWQGQKVWQTSASNQPFVVNRSRDEPLQEAIRKYEKPNYGFFSGVTLPRMIVRPGNGSGSRMLGSSRVTTTGIR